MGTPPDAAFEVVKMVLVDGDQECLMMMVMINDGGDDDETW